MPELPEVETIARGLHKRVVGDAIESVWLGSKPQTMKSPPAEIAVTLEHTRISAVRRMGKHIVFDLERNDVARALLPAKGRKKNVPLGPRSQWIVHLGMTGRMVVCDPDAEIVKHTHAIAKLGSGRELRFIDPRRFGRLSVHTTGDFEAGGVEPLEVEKDQFVRLFRGRKTPIKGALLNQKLLARRREHLRRRIPVSSGTSSATSSLNHHHVEVGTVAQVGAESFEGSDPAWRFFDF